MNPFRIGTRGSSLALWQARTVGARLEAAGHRIAITVIKTAGDRLQDAPGLPGVAAHKAVFVKEIEDALRREEIDIAVHSAKDMPVRLPEGLDIVAVLPREDPRDALVLAASTAVAAGAPDTADVDAVLGRLGATPAIGTSSVRRAAQLASLLPGAVFVPIRGNVDTRIRKLDEGQFDGLVLAAAGMIRLGMAGRISACLPIDRCIPAPGQGIVAIETRTADVRTRGVVEPLNDLEAFTCLLAERAVVSALGGGCQLPLGAIAVHEAGQLTMRAIVASPDGQRVVVRGARGPAGAAARLGSMLAGDLARAGATAILDEVRRTQ